MNPKIGFEITEDQIPSGSDDELAITVEVDLTPPEPLPLNSPSPEGSEA